MNKLSNITDSLIPAGLQASGFMLGIVGQRAINKVLESDMVSGFLGDETTVTFKRYISPLVMCGVGILVSNNASYDSPLKEIGNGAAVSGAVNVGMELLYKKNLLSGLGNGILGNLLGADDDLDIEDIDNYEEIESSAPRAISAGAPSYQPTRMAATEQIMGLPRII